MTRLTCPHCGQRAMSPWRKLGTNVVWSGRCQSCGEPIGIPAWSLHAWFLLVVAALTVAFYALPRDGLVALALVFPFMHVAFQLFVVPFERRDEGPQRSTGRRI